jgi:hypothetical protein
MVGYPHLIARRKNKEIKAREYWESLGISVGDTVQIKGTLSKDGYYIHLGREDKTKPQGTVIGMALADGEMGAHVIMAYSPEIGGMSGYTRVGIKEKKWKLYKKSGAK